MAFLCRGAVLFIFGFHQAFGGGCGSGQIDYTNWLFMDLFHNKGNAAINVSSDNRAWHVRINDGVVLRLIINEGGKR